MRKRTPVEQLWKVLENGLFGPWIVLEKSLNFVRPILWEPCSLHISLKYTLGLQRRCKVVQPNRSNDMLYESFRYATFWTSVLHVSFRCLVLSSFSFLAPPTVIYAELRCFCLALKTGTVLMWFWQYSRSFLWKIGNHSEIFVPLFMSSTVIILPVHSE